MCRPWFSAVLPDVFLYGRPPAGGRVEGLVSILPPASHLCQLCISAEELLAILFCTCTVLAFTVIRASCCAPGCFVSFCIGGTFNHKYRSPRLWEPPFVPKSLRLLRHSHPSGFDQGCQNHHVNPELLVCTIHQIQNFNAWAAWNDSKSHNSIHPMEDRCGDQRVGESSASTPTTPSLCQNALTEQRKTTFVVRADNEEESANAQGCREDPFTRLGSGLWALATSPGKNVGRSGGGAVWLDSNQPLFTLELAPPDED